MQTVFISYTNGNIRRGEEAVVSRRSGLTPQGVGEIAHRGGRRHLEGSADEALFPRIYHVWIHLGIQPGLGESRTESSWRMQGYQ